MKVYTATILKRKSDKASVAAEVFSQLEKAQAWANEKIDCYAKLYEYDITERMRYDFRANGKNGGTILIKIRAKEIHE